MATTYPAQILNFDGTEIELEGIVNFTSATNAPVPISTGPILLHSKAFAFGTAGLNTGLTIYTPAIGDVIYDCGVFITTAFNGTTPKADIGTFSGGNDGFFKTLATAVVDITAVDDAVASNAGIQSSATGRWLQAAVGSIGADAGAAYVDSQLRVTAANPILIVANQTGAKSGTAVGGTTGAGIAYVLAGTPG